MGRHAVLRAGRFRPYEASHRGSAQDGVPTHRLLLPAISLYARYGISSASISTLPKAALSTHHLRLHPHESPAGAFFGGSGRDARTKAFSAPDIRRALGYPLCPAKDRKFRTPRAGIDSWICAGT